MMKHASHDDVANRLRRAAGHLNSILRMIEEKRPCLELAQQIYAVEAAVAGAKQLLIHDHMDHCLNGSTKDAKAALKELKALTKYL